MLEPSRNQSGRKSDSPVRNDSTVTSPEVIPGMDVWATQMLVSDLPLEVERRIESGTFKRLPAPESTSGALLIDLKGIRLFLFPRDLAPGEPEVCQLFNARIPLAQAATDLTERGFSCGPIIEDCPWGPYFETKSASGQVSYVYQLEERYAPEGIYWSHLKLPD